MCIVRVINDSAVSLPALAVTQLTRFKPDVFLIRCVRRLVSEDRGSLRLAKNVAAGPGNASLFPHCGAIEFDADSVNARLMHG
jgi:hypothetical protein